MNPLSFHDRGQGEVLLLIHGLFGDLMDWEPVLEPLAERQRVIAIDLPALDTLAGYTDLLEELRRDLDVARMTLVGNSFGGLVAMHYALAYPDRVGSLVLAATAGFHRYTPAERRLARQRVQGTASARDLFGPLFATSSAITERYLARQEQKPDRQATAGPLELLLTQDVLDHAPGIACPVLLVWGDQDREAPIDRAWLALEKFAYAELRILADCGHMPQLDRPPLFVQAVQRFLVEIPIARSRAEHRAIEQHLDLLKSALHKGRPWREHFDNAWRLAFQHYLREDLELFETKVDWAPARKMMAQHAEASEFGRALASSNDANAERLAERYWAISQHNIIEEERDVFPCLRF
ncbi:MAG: alpha/beta fold hydrolase [Acidobacteria bacterium]|nr:alpha/beta fold hydrolase [Acidobacteriota bacterium]